MLPNLTDGMLLAAIPLGLSGLGWMVVKVIQHDAWLEDMRRTILRIEDKLDRVLSQ